LEVENDQETASPRNLQEEPGLLTLDFSSVSLVFTWQLKDEKFTLL
jgi:hypothetical protein